MQIMTLRLGNWPRILAVLLASAVVVAGVLCVVPVATTIAAAPVGQQKKAEATANYFLGEVEYKVSFGGSNREGLESLKIFSPTHVKIMFGQQGFRLIETGGLDHHVLLDFSQRQAYLLNVAEKTASKVNYYSLDDNVEQMQAVLPYHYRTELAATGQTATICGQACREYKILKSGFVRAGATGTVWIAEAIKFRPSRYNFENDTRRVISPLPLSLPIPTGAILKAEIIEDNVSLTYEAVSLKPATPAAEVFSLPADYKIQAP